MTRTRAGLLWHVATALVIALSLLVQLSLTIRGVNVLVDEQGRSPGAPERILRFFSYFTIQSNLFAMVAAISLVLKPDRDGALWRFVRLSAIIGMTVTFVVYIVALRPILDLHGAAKLTDIGFHYVAPILTAVGWLLFGPRPRIDKMTLVRHLIWPISYLVYVLILGAISGWYPYPFIDVDKIGYGKTALHAVLITLLLLAVGGVYAWLDRVLPVTDLEPPAGRTSQLT